MAEPSRGVQISRRRWLMAGLATPLLAAQGADTLAVTFDGDNLHVSSQDLHFLTGKPLERLQKGTATVKYGAQLRLFEDSAYTLAFHHSEAQFVVSYDIWQEKFSVTMSQPEKRAEHNLSATAAEAWCLDNLWINASGMAPDRRFWLELQVAVIPSRNIEDVLGPGISLAKVFVDLLSQKPGAEDPRWSRRVGPLRLADLARTKGRGLRG